MATEEQWVECPQAGKPFRPATLRMSPTGDEILYGNEIRHCNINGCCHNQSKCATCLARKLAEALEAVTSYEWLSDGRGSNWCNFCDPVPNPIGPDGYRPRGTVGFEYRHEDDCLVAKAVLALRLWRGQEADGG